MRKDTEKRLAKAIALIKGGASRDNAFKAAKIGANTYYQFKDSIATPTNPKKTKARLAPTLETIVTPHNAPKLAVVVGDAESILNILKGLNQ